MKLIALAVPVLAIVALSVPTQAAQTNGAYVNATGPHLASVSVCCTCTGPVTVTVTLADTGQSFTAQGKSLMSPDLCGIGCLDCPWPFAWAIVGPGVDLAGGGVAGGGWSMQGAFQGGVLEFNGFILSTP